MPIINVKLIEDVVTPDQKREIPRPSRPACPHRGHLR